MVKDAIRRRATFNILHLATMFKVDVFVVGADDLLVAEMARKQRMRVLDDPVAEVFVATAEDMVLQKLLWYRAGGEVSDRQWGDILGVIRTQKERLDLGYLRLWAARKELAAHLQRALAESGVAHVQGRWRLIPARIQPGRRSRECCAPLDGSTRHTPFLASLRARGLALWGGGSRNARCIHRLSEGRLGAGDGRWWHPWRCTWRWAGCSLPRRRHGQRRFPTWWRLPSRSRMSRLRCRLPRQRPRGVRQAQAWHRRPVLREERAPRFTAR